MDYKKQTQEIVKEIKELEEKKYKDINLKLNTETPTIIKYYANSLKKGKFSLKKNDLFSVRYSLMLGITSGGWAIGSSNSICVMARDYCSIPVFFCRPINEIHKNLPYQKMSIVNITFHEIRHILQHSGYYLPTYEYFCCDRLSDYKGLKALVSNNYHDSLYKEIDANFYGAQQSLIYFHGDENIKEYYSKMVGKFTIQKYAYDFDSYLEGYQKLNEKHQCKVGGMDYYEQFAWNQDGTFKKPKEILTDEKFYEMIEGYPDTIKLYSRIIASDAYLSRLNIEELDDTEIEFIKKSIENTNICLEQDKGFIMRCYQNKAITQKEYEKSMSKINSWVNKKEQYLNKIDINNKVEEQPINTSEKSVEELIEDLLTPEPPKKVKLVTTAKESLKRIIDKIVRIPTGIAIVGIAYLSEIMAILTQNNALSLIGAAVMGAGITAAEIHKHTSSKK